MSGKRNAEKKLREMEMWRRRKQMLNKKLKQNLRNYFV